MTKAANIPPPGGKWHKVPPRGSTPRRKHIRADQQPAQLLLALYEELHTTHRHQLKPQDDQRWKSLITTWRHDTQEHWKAMNRHLTEAQELDPRFKGISTTGNTMSLQPGIRKGYYDIMKKWERHVGQTQRQPAELTSKVRDTIAAATPTRHDEDPLKTDHPNSKATTKTTGTHQTEGHTHESDEEHMPKVTNAEPTSDSKPDDTSTTDAIMLATDMDATTETLSDTSTDTQSTRPPADPNLLTLIQSLEQRLQHTEERYHQTEVRLRDTEHRLTERENIYLALQVQHDEIITQLHTMTSTVKTLQSDHADSVDHIQRLQQRHKETFLPLITKWTDQDTRLDAKHRTIQSRLTKLEDMTLTAGRGVEDVAAAVANGIAEITQRTSSAIDDIDRTADIAVEDLHSAYQSSHTLVGQAPQDTNSMDVATRKLQQQMDASTAKLHQLVGQVKQQLTQQLEQRLYESTIQQQEFNERTQNDMRDIDQKVSDYLRRIDHPPTAPSPPTTGFVGPPPPTTRATPASHLHTRYPDPQPPQQQDGHHTTGDPTNPDRTTFRGRTVHVAPTQTRPNTRPRPPPYENQHSRPPPDAYDSDEDAHQRTYIHSDRDYTHSDRSYDYGYSRVRQQSFNKADVPYKLKYSSPRSKEMTVITFYNGFQVFCRRYGVYLPSFMDLRAETTDYYIPTSTRMTDHERQEERHRFAQPLGIKLISAISDDTILKTLNPLFAVDNDGYRLLHHLLKTTLVTLRQPNAPAVFTRQNTMPEYDQSQNIFHFQTNKLILFFQYQATRGRTYSDGERIQPFLEAMAQDSRFSEAMKEAKQICPTDLGAPVPAEYQLGNIASTFAHHAMTDDGTGTDALMPGEAQINMGAAPHNTSTTPQPPTNPRTHTTSDRTRPRSRRPRIQAQCNACMGWGHEADKCDFLARLLGCSIYVKAHPDAAQAVADRFRRFNSKEAKALIQRCIHVDSSTNEEELTDEQYEQLKLLEDVAMIRTTCVPAATAEPLPRPPPADPNPIAWTGLPTIPNLDTPDIQDPTWHTDPAIFQSVTILPHPAYLTLDHEIEAHPTSLQGPSSKPPPHQPVTSDRPLLSPSKDSQPRSEDSPAQPPRKDSPAQPPRNHTASPIICHVQVPQAQGDTGANRALTNCRDILHAFQPITPFSIGTIGNTSIQAMGQGDLHLRTQTGTVECFTCYYSADASGTVISPDRHVLEHLALAAWRQDGNPTTGHGTITFLDASQQPRSTIRMETHNSHWYTDQIIPPPTQADPKSTPSAATTPPAHSPHISMTFVAPPAATSDHPSYTPGTLTLPPVTTDWTTALTDSDRHCPSSA